MFTVPAPDDFQRMMLNSSNSKLKLSFLKKKRVNKLIEQYM